MTELSLSPQRLCRILGGMAAGLALVNLITQFLHYKVGGTVFDVVAGRFDLDGEANIPTWFSSSLLLACAALLQVIALARRTAHDPCRAHWQGLAIVFLGVSLDETACLRQFPSWVLHKYLRTSGPFENAWVLPAAAAIVVLGLSYLRFFLRLPRTVRNLFFLAAGIYVSGALGMEMVEGVVGTAYGKKNFAFQWLITVEEYAEMIGVTVFLWALLLHLRAEAGVIGFRIERDPHPIRIAGEVDSSRLRAMSRRDRPRRA